MSKTDFQNGFALGLASGGNVTATELDYTVRFLVDGKPYEIVSVKSGNKVSKPLTDPISENGKFTGWKDNNGKVDFPYPSENVIEGVIELSAVFQTVRDEISTDKAGTNLGSVLGTKKNDGLCVLAYGPMNSSSPNGWNSYYIIGKSTEAIKTTNSFAKTGDFTYENETWYWGKINNNGTPILDGDVEFYSINQASDTDSSISKVLDYYFMKT